MPMTCVGSIGVFTARSLQRDRRRCTAICFEIDERAAKTAGLEVSFKLLRLASSVGASSARQISSQESRGHTR
jgi:hypothetical protein